MIELAFEKVLAEHGPLQWCACLAVDPPFDPMPDLAHRATELDFVSIPKIFQLKFCSYIHKYRPMYLFRLSTR